MEYITLRSGGTRGNGYTGFNIITYLDAPRHSQSGSYVNPVVSSNLYVYVKSGEVIEKHWLDKNGKDTLRITKGKKKIEGPVFLGITTGKTGITSEGKAIVQVQWVNEWTENKFLVFGKETVKETVVSYVLADQIEIYTAQTNVSVIGGTSGTNGNNGNSEIRTSSNLESIILGAGLVAVVADKN